MRSRRSTPAGAAWARPICGTSRASTNWILPRRAAMGHADYTVHGWPGRAFAGCLPSRNQRA